VLLSGIAVVRINAEKLIMKALMHDRSTRIGGQRQEGIAALHMVAAFSVVLVLSAMTYARNALWQDPVRLWEDTVRKSPQKARVRYNMATLYEARGYPDLAESAYRAVLGLEPDHVMAHNNLGNVYANQARYEEAARELQSAIRLDPNAPLSRDNLGYVYFQLGRIDEAIREYRAALALAPDSAEIHNNLGYVYLSQGRFDDADEQFRTALKIKPDFPAALDNTMLLMRERSRLKRQK
jgi:Tfp pilus assembly protein PilF